MRPGARGLGRRAAIALGAVLAILVGSRSEAQSPVPVVMVPGLHEDSTHFSLIAGDLSNALSGIRVLRPSFNTNVTYALQAGTLAQYLAVAGNVDSGASITVGHSNGGVVARELGRTFGLKGNLTFGTPHGGVPLVPNISAALGFANGALSAFNGLFSDIGALSCYGYLYYQDWCWNVVLYASLTLDYLVIPAILNYPIADFLPTSALLNEVTPNSSYLTSLNSSGNLASEANLIRHRAGIVVTTLNYYYGGPLRLYNSPGTANALGADVVYAGGLAWQAGNWAYAAADSMMQEFLYGGEFDPYLHYLVSEVANELYNAAFYLLNYEYVWCDLINGGVGVCGPSDSFIPVLRQRYPGAQDTIPVTGLWAHTFEWADQLVIEQIRFSVSDILQSP